MIGTGEIIIIAVGIIVLLFGGKKVVEWSRSLGRVTGEFKKGKREIEEELEQTKRELGQNEDNVKKFKR